MEDEGRDGQVRVQLLRLDKAIEGLRATIGLVDERLGSILCRVSLKTAENRGVVEEDQLVTLADEIRSHRKSVQAQSDRLQGMLSRIEL